VGQHARLYKTKAWYRLRHAQLQAEPLCRMCKQLGRVTAANVIDHIKPHRGNLELFHDPANIQALCKPCHDGAKQAQERTGQLRGGDTEGRPIDPNHHWNNPARSCKMTKPTQCDNTGRLLPITREVGNGCYQVYMRQVRLSIRRSC